MTLHMRRSFDVDTRHMTEVMDAGLDKISIEHSKW